MLKNLQTNIHLKISKVVQLKKVDLKAKLPATIFI